MREIVALITPDYGTICLACAEAVRPGYPRCSSCGAMPSQGWRSLMKRHRACQLGTDAPRFLSCDDEPLRLEVGTLTCQLCDEVVEPGLTTADEPNPTVLITAPQSKRELLHNTPDQMKEGVRDAIR